MSKAKVIMVQGTMSGVGKSLVVAGLCRVLHQDGYRVAPFKSQNMALNSYVTEDGCEMGRAQVMQAEAAGEKPDVRMNPILLKPTDNIGSQVIVNGKVFGQMKAKEYFEFKRNLVPEILKAYESLSEEYDVIVIEGAGSPAEINLKENDIVNMGMAQMVNAPVILVGDIDRGGVFAQLLGTLMLLEEDEKSLVKGLVVNKFRGDKSILDPGIKMLEEKGNVPVVGVLPYMDIALEDEDSLSDRFEKTQKGMIDIAVIRLPRISNFTDFDTFDQLEGVSVRYVTNNRNLGDPDMLIIPGSKSTISDLIWLRESGLEIKIRQLAQSGVPIMGICGGYQMLGETIEDPTGVEYKGKIEGLALLPVKTIMQSKKNTSQFKGRIVNAGEELCSIAGYAVYGYEIHMGETTPIDELEEFTSNQTGYLKRNVYGTYIHGFYDNREILTGIIESLARKKNITLDVSSAQDYRAFKEKEYDRLASMIREYMDMDAIKAQLNSCCD